MFDSNKSLRDIADAVKLIADTLDEGGSEDPEAQEAAQGYPIMAQQMRIADGLNRIADNLPGGGSQPIIPLYTYNTQTEAMECNMSLSDICNAIASGACTFAFVLLNGKESPMYFRVAQFMPPSAVLFDNLVIISPSDPAVYTMLMHDSGTGIRVATANWALS